MRAPDVSHWTASDLRRALTGTDTCDAVCCGTPVWFATDGELYAVVVYPPGRDAIEEIVATPEAALSRARALCREHAPAAWDSWQTEENIASGLQGALWL
jgi:hypothetical protein